MILFPSPFSFFFFSFFLFYHLGQTGWLGLANLVVAQVENLKLGIGNQPFAQPLHVLIVQAALMLRKEKKKSLVR